MSAGRKEATLADRQALSVYPNIGVTLSMESARRGTCGHERTRSCAANCALVQVCVCACKRGKLYFGLGSPRSTL